MAFQEAAHVSEAFREKFGSAEGVRVWRAPGRVNLIGEHTDYNLGFVLPMALSMACYAAAAPSNDGVLRLWSVNLDDTVELPVSDVAAAKPRGHWSDYPIGVAQQLLRLGFDIRALNVAIHSNVPGGAGLSSSAALEVSSALALLDGRPIDRKELALLSQRAEREFVGVPCGIMDQYVSVFGEEGKAVCIDCRSIDHRSVKLPGPLAIVAVNSMVKHELGSSEYAVRVRECQEAVAVIREAYPEVSSLRDVSSETVDRLRGSMPENVLRRARHVTTEDERVQRFLEVAEKGDLLAMGRLFLASHRSLQQDYEVSAPELDYLVDTASAFSGVYGARMTGGGFGGCTVNLVSPDRVEAFGQHISAAYSRRFGIVPQIYRCVPSEGAGQAEAD